MRPLKSFALAASVAAGLLVAPVASASGSGTPNEAWPPGNCPKGAFCVWPHWAHPEPAPVEAPSLVTTGDWAGSVPALTYYNYTSGNVDMEHVYTWPDGTTRTGRTCVAPGGNIFYLPVAVTKVSRHAGPC